MRPTSHEPRLKAGNCVLHPDEPKAEATEQQLLMGAARVPAAEREQAS
jgi:hypothetical protein